MPPLLLSVAQYCSATVFVAGSVFAPAVVTMFRPLFTLGALLQEYIEKLRWVDKFVRDEVEPLDQLNFSPCEPRYSRRPES